MAARGPPALNCQSVLTEENLHTRVCIWGGGGGKDCIRDESLDDKKGHHERGLGKTSNPLMVLM